MFCILNQKTYGGQVNNTSYMTEVDNRYRRQSIKDLDVELPYIDLSIADNWPVIKTCIVIFVISALITPFLPPLHSSYSFKWTAPKSPGDYYEQVKYIIYLFVVVVGCILIADVLSNIRTSIDRRFGYKKVGVFSVIAIWNLWTRKIVFLNNAHFFMLKQKDDGFAKIKIGQVVEIERTATHRFLDYHITK
jgi:hypothetical protein